MRRLGSIRRPCRGFVVGEARPVYPRIFRSVPVQKMKDVGFVSNRCKGQTWVKGEGDKNPSRYTSLPQCSKIIVATPEDMKKVGER
jgi:hypothetical protein